TKDSPWTVTSAEEFLKRIQHLEVKADEEVVSFDMILFFTSIPPALIINTIDGLPCEKYDETENHLKREHIIELLGLCLKTFFTFNGQVLQLGPPKFWVRYVDDTFVILKRTHVQAFKASVNSIFPDIPFTIQEEVNNRFFACIGKSVVLP
ncbi:unnamed protein product, partial [Dibothriocephalus latus]